MNINIYDEIKKSIKDALTEWYNENKNKLVDIYKKEETGEVLLTVKQFCKKHSFVSEGGLRDKLTSREYNKFNACCSKVGKRILIKEKAALDWFSTPPAEANWKYDKKKWGLK